MSLVAMPCMHLTLHQDTLASACDKAETLTMTLCGASIGRASGVVVCLSVSMLKHSFFIHKLFFIYFSPCVAIIAFCEIMYGGRLY